ncbi:MAG: DUF2911 domain-containing protein [Flavipsychrobacter sp.]|nr:DUF2911 domain-containing protein [Flavipsychrobacter sp.]
MKKIASFIAIATLAATSTFAQEKTVASPRVTAKSENVTVSYGQPSKKGREIFGGLVPYGQVWRTGANEATEITFSKVTKFGGKTVKPGTYTLFTTPEKNEWTIILNSKLKQWGSFKYDEIKKNDVLHVTVPVQQLNAPVEKLTINVTDASLNIQWDKTGVTVPMSVE